MDHTAAMSFFILCRKYHSLRLFYSHIFNMYFRRLIPLVTIVGAIADCQAEVRSTPALRNEMPSVVYFPNPHNKGKFSTGTIYSRRWVLTSARYCNVTANYTVYAGVYDATNETERDSWQIVPVNKVILHKKAALVFDLCLLRLERPLKFSPSVQQSLLFDNYLIPAKTSLSFYGWRDSDAGHRKLEKLTVTSISDAECARQIPGFRKESMVCALAKDPGSCYRDAGAPLILNLDGKLLQVGFMTMHYHCVDHKRKHLIFTDLSKTLNWVVENVDSSP